MLIIYREGDFLAGPETVLIHGCNAQRKFNKGASKAVREQLPFAYEAYMAAPVLRCGSVIWALGEHRGRPRIVGNAITQQFYGNRGHHIDYVALRAVMQEVDRFISTATTNERWREECPMNRLVAMPMIGSGLAGGDWQIIAEIIEEASVNFQPVVYRLPTDGEHDASDG